MSKWLEKGARELLEFEEFLRGYSTMANCDRPRSWRRRERPDWELQFYSGDIAGVEMTAAYESRNSVRRLHLEPYSGLPDFNEARLRLYLARLVEIVAAKTAKARSGYELYPRMILGVYVADDIAIYLRGQAAWETFAQEHEAELTDIAPFSEVVFCNLPNGGCLSVRRC